MNIPKFFKKGKNDQVEDELDNDLNLDDEIAEESSSKKGGGIAKKIIIAVAMVSVQCVLAYFLLTQIALPKLLQPNENPEVKDTEVTKPKKEKERPTFNFDKESEVDDIEAAVHTIEDLVVNPAGTRAKRFLVVSMAFIISGKNGIEEIEKREHAIKDGIITLLSRKNADWLTVVDNREILRREIRLITNRKLSEGQVTKIYFTKYVLQ